MIDLQPTLLGFDGHCAGPAFSPVPDSRRNVQRQGRPPVQQVGRVIDPDPAPFIHRAFQPRIPALDLFREQDRVAVEGTRQAR